MELSVNVPYCLELKSDFFILAFSSRDLGLSNLTSDPLLGPTPPCFLHFFFPLVVFTLL